jgi:hypothetical protein
MTDEGWHQQFVKMLVDGLAAVHDRLSKEIAGLRQHNDDVADKVRDAMKATAEATHKEMQETAAQVKSTAEDVAARLAETVKLRCTDCPTRITVDSIILQSKGATRLAKYIYAILAVLAAVALIALNHYWK